ncbi:hypothetical protein [Halorubrum sp. Atlit-26R]|uniref:hypothetical protein n=1 Tax=Halorubrum sp. Atlit-26R TaxID=2282128 RepID=UPI000EF1AFA7|nr:hypothetical protein [Halorubrum sp. Atlit-26R]RLM63656.1 hypothetical protein DVK07_15905 [Halorubrum sp. Atlit-26R]
MTIEPLRDRILIGVGGIAVSAGAYLPWLKTNPKLPLDAEIPTIYIPGMNVGFEAFDFALLGLIGLVLVFRGSSRKRLQSVVTLLTGVGTVLFCGLYLSGSLTGFTATFVPAFGWCLTVLGGVSLTVAGVLQHFRGGAPDLKERTE